MRDADPAGAVLVLLAEPVPVELHLHPPVLVGVDLLAGGTDDDRRLRSLHERLRREPLRSELLRGRHRDERAAIARPARLGQRLVVLERQVVARADDQVLAVLIVARVVLERQQRPDRQPARVRRRMRRLELRAHLVDPHRGVLLAVRPLDVEPGIVVDLVVARRVAARQRLAGLQLDARPLEIVVVVHVDARLDLPPEVPGVHVLDVGLAPAASAR